MSITTEPLPLDLKTHRLGLPESVTTLPELPPVIDFAGLPVCPLTEDELLDALVARAAMKVRSRVHYLNAHAFNLARRNSELHGLLRQADLLYADGISIVWAARLLGYSIPGRLTAADYFEEFCRRCAAESLSLFFVGGAAGVAEIAAQRLQRKVPGLVIAGTSHGYLSEAESADLVQRINASRADIAIVGMSSGRQETWVRKFGPQLTAPVQWTVGALLDYFAGTEPRAPRAVCDVGCEWLFRLLVRPASRWRRYVLGNFSFACWLIGECLLPGRKGRARLSDAEFINSDLSQPK